MTSPDITYKRCHIYLLPYESDRKGNTFPTTAQILSLYCHFFIVYTPISLSTHALSPTRTTDDEKYSKDHNTPSLSLPCKQE